MQDGRPHDWFVKCAFEHAADCGSLKGELIVWFDALEKAVTSLAFLPGDGVSHMFDKKDVGAILEHESYDVNQHVVRDEEDLERFVGVPAYSLAVAVADEAFAMATEGLPEMGRECWIVEYDESDIELSCPFTMLVRDGAEMRREIMLFFMGFDPALRKLKTAGFLDPGRPPSQASPEGRQSSSRWLTDDEKRTVMDRIRL
jgi:hypothetical protein